MKDKIMKIEDIINQRLKMQSTQKNLQNEFGLDEFSSSTVLTFVTTDFKNLSDTKQKKFIMVLGGPANFKKTQYYINSL